MSYPVRIPTEKFDQAAKTHEAQFWTDDRGCTYAAACVDKPLDSSETVWQRSTPQPNILEH